MGCDQLCGRGSGGFSVVISEKLFSDREPFLSFFQR